MGAEDTESVIMAGPVAGRVGDCATPSIAGGPVGAALQLGWTMGTIYDPPLPASRPGRELPTVGELTGERRIDLELQRLEGLLAELGAAIADPDHPFPTDIAALRGAWRPDAAGLPGADAPEIRHSELRGALETFHVKVLDALASAGDGLDAGYEVGQWLRCTAHPLALAAAGQAVTPLDALLTAFARRRISALQRGLRMLAPAFPPDAAAVVSESLGKWSGFCQTVLDGSSPGGLREPSQVNAVAADMLEILGPQGDTWLHVLTGVQSTEGLVSPEAAVAAAEAELHRARRLVGKVVLHYLPAFGIVLAALGGIIYLAQSDLAGAARVWTEIAAIAGSLGVTAHSVGSAVGRLARDGAAPFLRLQAVDAKAWAVTTLPAVQLNASGMAELRRSGIAMPSRLARS